MIFTRKGYEMARKIKLLIVEDEALAALLLRTGFQLLGYEVEEPVNTGELAIQKAAETQPDVVLMDIRLIGAMDGIEAAQKINARYGISIVFMTGYSDEETMQRARVVDAPYLIKPQTPAQLHPVIQKVLQKSWKPSPKSRRTL